MTTARFQSRVLVVLSLALLGVLVLVIASAAVVDLRTRANGPEVVVRLYFAALEDGDVATALDQIVPAERSRWGEFVENGVYNQYRVTGIAVRSPSVLERLSGQRAGPRDATIFLDITQWTDGVRWQAGPRVPLVIADGRTYLQVPPLAPEP